MDTVHTPAPNPGRADLLDAIAALRNAERELNRLQEYNSQRRSPPVVCEKTELALLHVLNACGYLGISHNRRQAADLLERTRHE